MIQEGDHLPSNPIAVALVRIHNLGSLAGELFIDSH